MAMCLWCYDWSLNCTPGWMNSGIRKYFNQIPEFTSLSQFIDRLCGLVVTVPGYRSRGPGFDSRCYHWEVVGLKRGPLSLVKIIEELLDGKVAAPVLKAEINCRGDPLRWPRDTLYPQKLALTSPTRGGRSVGIVRLWTKKKPRSFSQFIIHCNIFLCLARSTVICNFTLIIHLN
jgi:hypothetical protein